MLPCSENRIDNLTMFWDRVAGVYDLFANYYNAGTHRVLCHEVALVSSEDDVLECACGTGPLRCRGFVKKGAYACC